MSFSPPTVGAYRIRPDVGEQEMTAANIPVCVIVLKKGALI